jgi:hypothetical protein
MRFRVVSGVILTLFLAPIARVNAQTVEIQEKITIKLWFQRLLQRLEAGGVPSIFFFFALVAVALMFLVAIWLRKSRQNQTGKPTVAE